MLPGRRQRKRKERKAEETTVSQSIAWQQIRKSLAILIPVLVLLLAFYYAIMAEN